MKLKLNDDDRKHLDRLAEGWRPFPFQLSGGEVILWKLGLVTTELDERDRNVLVLTDAGREEIRAHAATKPKTKTRTKKE